MLQTLLSPEEGEKMDQLLTETDECYLLTALKRQPKDFTLGEMRREIARGEQLVPLYKLATQIVPQHGISG